jgi:hypothetical protein
VEIELLVNGQKVKPLGRHEHLETGSKGSFVGRYRMPQGALPEARGQAVSYASRSGVPVETVSKVILRHANLSTTQRYLGKVSDAEAVRWIAKIYTHC